MTYPSEIKFQPHAHDPALKSTAQRGLGPNGRAAIFGENDMHRHFYDVKKLKEILSDVPTKRPAKRKSRLPSGGN